MFAGGGEGKNGREGGRCLVAGDEDTHRELVDEWDDPLGIKARLYKSECVRKFKSEMGG